MAKERSHSAIRRTPSRSPSCRTAPLPLLAPRTRHDALGKDETERAPSSVVPIPYKLPLYSTKISTIPDGDPAIGGIDVQLVPDPGGGMALGVALAADIASASASICGRLIVSCRSSRLGSFARASPLRGRPRLRRFGFAAFGFGAGFSRASIPPSHPARCARQDIHRQSASHADGWPSRQTRKRPAKTSPRSEAGRHRSSRTAGIACRQPQDARSGRASSECRTPPWL